MGGESFSYPQEIIFFYVSIWSSIGKSPRNGRTKSINFLLMKIRRMKILFKNLVKEL